MQSISGALLVDRRVGTVLLLLGVACFFIQCSQNDADDPGDPSFETYFHLDSTYIGISTVANNLDIPWEITWGPDDWIWMTEHGGTVSKIDPESGEKKEMLKLDDVYAGTTPGLLGMAVHPDQAQFPYLFLVYHSQSEADTIFWNVIRFTIESDTLKDRHVLAKIHGSAHHGGSRIKISPDGKLLVANGDAGKDAQDINSELGKILRLNIDGTIPDDNPLPNSPVWAWGFRNQQGLAYGPNGILYDSDHGPATDDEINIIEKGQNYGWPTVNGFCDKPEERSFCADSSVMEPIKAWTPTIAPAGIAYYGYEEIPEWQHALILTTLKNSSVHVLLLDDAGRSIKKETVYLDHFFGRLRDITVSPVGDIYISTSNQDWKPDPGEGFPKSNDDRIIRLSRVKNRSSLKDIPSVQQLASDSTKTKKKLSQGGLIYRDYCASCHQPDGSGLKGSFPPLAESDFVSDDRNQLISVVLNGTNTEKYPDKMSSFEFLSDEKVAKLLTYIRTNLENHASKITEEQVKEVRNNQSEK